MKVSSKVPYFTLHMKLLSRARSNIKEFLRNTLNAVVCLFIWQVVCCATTRIQLDVSDVTVSDAGKFALRELQKLSDSSIYSTLTLANILSAYEVEGIFHQNLVLTVELHCPHFQSGRDVEQFEIFVMTHKEDGVRSFAIDEFPMMEKSAVENFSDANAVRRRKKNEESFRRLELTALSPSETSAHSSIQEQLNKHSSDRITAVRKANSLAVQKQLSGDFISQEASLAQLSLGDLFSITIGEGFDGTLSVDVTDFQMYRAKQILDAVISYLQHQYH